ncbi:hypothetical protein D3C86_2022880 [compost metagenome]
MVRQQRMDDAFDPAFLDQVTCCFLEVTQRFYRDPVFVHELAEERNRLGLRTHVAQIHCLKHQLIKVIAEFPRLID